MSNRSVQYRVGKEWLYYLYRSVVLPWELDWSTSNFNTNLGKLKEYQKQNNILLKCFRSVADLEVGAKNYPQEHRGYAGVMLFNRTDNKPKAILRHLRHISAHGHFRSKTMNKVKCLGFEHRSDRDNKLRAVGHLPFDELKPLLAAIMTTRAN